MPSTLELTLKSPDALERALNLLEQHGADALEFDEQPILRVFARFAVPPEHSLWRSIAGSLHLRGIAYENLQVREAESLDWDSVWRPVAQPVLVSKVWIVPEECQLTPEMVPAIRLKVGTAFGSGLHPTTALCVQALSEFPATEEMVDFGCGTGILALSALALGTRRAVAVDTAADAREVTRYNSVLNECADALKVSDRWHGRSKRIVANVLAMPLIDLAPFLVQRLLPGGELWLSGIRDDQVDAVSRTYRHFGLHRVGETRLGDWVRLDFRTSW